MNSHLPLLIQSELSIPGTSLKELMADISGERNKESLDKNARLAFLCDRLSRFHYQINLSCAAKKTVSEYE